MSVVLDALNKAQKEQQDGRSGRSFYREEFRALKKKYKYWIVALVVINLVIFIGGGTLIYYNSDSIKQFLKSIVASSENKVVQNELEITAVATQPEVRPNLAEKKLSPVVKTSNKPFDSDSLITIDKNYFAVKGGPTLKISGVMKDGDNSSVIIGEEFLLIGEEIDGVVIEKVTRRKLTLSYKGKSYVVPI